MFKTTLLFQAIVCILLIICSTASAKSIKNQIVKVEIKTELQSPEEIAKFKNWLTDKLEAFSEEKKEFKVSHDSANYTHSIVIYIDSIVIIDYQKYKKDLQIVDTVAENTSKVTNSRLLRSAISNIVQGIINTVSLEEASHPSMNMRLEIVDKNKKVQFHKARKLESILPEAVDEKHQLSDLFSVLKVYVQEELPYFE